MCLKISFFSTWNAPEKAEPHSLQKDVYLGLLEEFIIIKRDFSGIDRMCVREAYIIIVIYIKLELYVVSLFLFQSKVITILLVISDFFVFKWGAQGGRILLILKFVILSFQDVVLFKEKNFPFFVKKFSPPVFIRNLISKVLHYFLQGGVAGS